MKPKVQRHDGLVGDGQISQLHKEMAKGHLKRLVFDFSEREPELVMMLAERIDHIEFLFNQHNIGGRSRQILSRQIPLVAWPAVLILDRAHRRAWDDLLPPIMVNGSAADPDDGAEGGAV